MILNNDTNKRQRVGRKNKVKTVFSRMIFNCLAVNQDDHVKNISFLMNRNGDWKLSPAYDVTFSYNPTNRWLRSHQDRSITIF